mgnify:CR=1 FL=1
MQNKLDSYEVTNVVFFSKKVIKRSYSTYFFLYNIEGSNF